MKTVKAQAVIPPTHSPQPHDTEPAPNTPTADDGLVALKKLAIKRAITQLRGAGAQFAIIEQDGTRHGELEVVEPKVRVRRWRRGSFSDYYKPFVDNLKVGESTSVPWGEFGAEEDKESFRGSLCGYLCKLWGNSTFLTHASEYGIAVMRCEPNVLEA